MEPKRVFDNDSSLTFEDIFKSILNDKIEQFFKEFENQDKKHESVSFSNKGEPTK